MTTIAPSAQIQSEAGSVARLKQLFARLRLADVELRNAEGDERAGGKPKSDPAAIRAEILRFERLIAATPARDSDDLTWKAHAITRRIGRTLTARTALEVEDDHCGPLTAMLCSLAVDVARLAPAETSPRL